MTPRNPSGGDTAMDHFNIAVKHDTKVRFEKFREGLTKVGKASHDDAVVELLDLWEKSRKGK